MNRKVVLASSSPRRKQLLSKIISEFEIIPSDVEEIYPNTISTMHVSLYLSDLKAYDIHKKYPNDIVIGCDTSVIINDVILGKPKNKTHAKEMLSSLSNNMHYVVSGITVYDKDSKYQINSISKVYFKNLSIQEIDEYLENDEYKDKAGGYAIQGLANKFIDRFEGEYESIVGLPIIELDKLLKSIIK